jgi:hypothetical protein
MGVCDVSGIVTRPAGVRVLVLKQEFPAISRGFLGEGIDLGLCAPTKGSVIQAGGGPFMDPAG